MRGTLEIRTHPVAQITIDGRAVAQGNWIAIVSAGRHRVTTIVRGEEPMFMTVVVAPGKTTAVTVWTGIPDGRRNGK